MIIPSQFNTVYELNINFVVILYEYKYFYVIIHYDLKVYSHTYIHILTYTILNIVNVKYIIYYIILYIKYFK